MEKIDSELSDGCTDASKNMKLQLMKYVYAIPQTNNENAKKSSLICGNWVL